MPLEEVTNSTSYTYAKLIFAKLLNIISVYLVLRRVKYKPAFSRKFSGFENTKTNLKVLIITEQIWKTGLERK
jgi:hypothetical protein